MACDSNTLLLCHQNTDFSDSSTYNRTPTLHNVPTIDGTTKKMGAGAGKYVAASSQWVGFPDSNDWNFGTGNFTWDTWVYFSTSANEQ